MRDPCSPLLGFIHSTVWQMLIYSAGVAAALATGEYLDQRRSGQANLAVLLQEALLWWLLVGALGGCAYILARGARWLFA